MINITSRTHQSSNYQHHKNMINSEDEKERGGHHFFSRQTNHKLSLLSSSLKFSSSFSFLENTKPNGVDVQRRKRRKSSKLGALSSRINGSSPFSNHQLNHLLIVIFTLLLLLLNSSPAVSAAEFNIEKLQEYNSLATCIGQIHKDFEVCNTKGAEKAKSFKVDLGEEWNRRLQCCGMWKLRDCWMKAARAKCSKAQAEQVFKLPHLFLPDLATSCAEFTPESGKCSIPMWLLASVGSAALVLALTCLCGACLCVRKLRARVTRRSALHRRHAPKQSSGKNGGVSTSLISSSSVASNGGGGVQLMPSSLANGGGGGKSKKSSAALNGKLSRPKNGYTNGGAGGAARVTINIEEATSDEVKSLNAVDLPLQQQPHPTPVASVV